MIDQLMGYDPKAGALVPVSALVDHPTSNQVRIRYSKGTHVAVFQRHDKPVEVLIACEGFDSYRMNVDAPPKGQHMVLEHDAGAQEFLITYFNDIFPPGVSR